MSLVDVETALARIADEPERAWFAGPRDPTVIEAAERALGGQLPPSYRVFVERLGAGNFGAFEVYGVLDSKFEGPVPDAVWVTLDERSRGTVASDLIIIGDSGDGGYYCIRQGADDGPVCLVPIGAPPEPVALDFGAYLRSHVELA